MSRDLHFKQLAHVGKNGLMSFAGALFGILAVVQLGYAQTGSDSKQQQQTAIQVQANSLENGFAGGITSNDFVPLMDLIQSVIDPDSWQDSGGEGALIEYPAGVFVDGALAVSSVRSNLDPSRHPSFNDGVVAVGKSASDVNDASALRTVSLNRIEDAIEAVATTGRPFSDQLKNLAGIYRVDYVFIDAQNDDVLIAGPAGPWRTDTKGRIVNVETGLPTLQLDDLIVCFMNAFNDNGRFGCTIEPKPSSLKSAQEFLTATTGQATGRKWRESLRAAVGRQNVIVHGISPDCGVAETIVGADYLMKKIGMGLEPTIGDCPSYFDRVKEDPSTAQGQTLIRWWFTMAYDSLTKDVNDRVFKFSGDSIKVLSENELLGQRGQRLHTGTSDNATGGFAEDFSEHIERMAEKHPVFASLKNVFDLALVANIVKKYDVKNRHQWQCRFAAASTDSSASSDARTQYVLASHQFNDEVDSILNFETFNFKMSGKRFRRTVVGVSGGVEFDFDRLFKQLNVVEQSQSQFPQSPLDKAPKRQWQNQTLVWWWD